MNPYTFVRIPAGTFVMGSPPDEPGRFDSETQHQVTLTQDFFMMTTEVTQAQWQAVMGNNPSYFINCGGDCPVEQVSWNDIQQFITALNAMEGKAYRLPTEAEWEYAARAGTTTAFSIGDISIAEYTCSQLDPNLNQVGWYCGNAEVSYTGCQDFSPMGAPSCTGTLTVAKKQANDWGLYDMHGNVNEWCQDWKGDYPENAATDPMGPSTGTSRIWRGGSYGSYAWGCRSADRAGGSPDTSFFGTGFRLAITQNR